MRKVGEEMNGLLFINKPKGLTSRDVVNQISRIYGVKKVGHTGTLDPLATGVLIVCVGSYTKLVNLLTSSYKEYIASVKFGIKTDTGDITGNVLETKDVSFSYEELKQVIDTFPKEYIQTVPMYSAVKVNGKKLYEYAREGKEVELPKRQVFINDLELLECHDDIAKIRTVVSKGTYIRSLIEDIARRLNTVAVMSGLVRTKQGNVSLEECILLKDITKNTPLKTVDEVFLLPKIEVNQQDYKRVINGNPLFLDMTEPRIFVTHHNDVVAMYEKKEDSYHIIFQVRPHA